MLTRPTFPNPLTDFTYFLSPNYKTRLEHGLCGRLQQELMDCLEAYGAHKGRIKCRDLIYDSIECSHNTFQDNRVKVMVKERLRQYREGKLKTPFEPHPPMDSFFFI